MHEITMDVPVTNVEWVGNMSGPTMLPERASSLSPEQPSRMETLVEEDSTSSDPETATVRKRVSLQEQDMARNAPPIQKWRDLFSDSRPAKDRLARMRRPADMSNGSPLQIERPNERPRKKTVQRPRIAAETFTPPPVSSSLPAGPAESTNTGNVPTLQIQETRRFPKIRQTPTVSKSYRARIVSSSQSSSLSSQDSDSEVSDREWFTPPTTQRDKGKAPLRSVNTQAPTNAASSMVRQSLQPLGMPASPLTTPSSLYSRSNARMMEPMHKNIPDDDHVSPSTETYNPRTPQRQVWINAPESSSPFDSPDSLYSRLKPGMAEDSFAGRKSEKSVPQRTIAGHSTIAQRQFTGDIPAAPESPSSIYSRLTSGEIRPTPPDAHRPANSGLSQPETIPRALEQHPAYKADELSLSDDTPSSLYSRPTSGGFRRSRNGIDSEVGVLEQEIPGPGSGRVTHRPMRRATISADEISRLREDNEALKQEMQALREEFRELKAVLLRT
jgi:hypothetical protein